MPKRRRERDRPKARPGAPYNPNERILLSYDSEGIEDVTPNEGDSPAADTASPKAQQAVAEAESHGPTPGNSQDATLDDEDDYTPPDVICDLEITSDADNIGRHDRNIHVSSGYTPSDEVVYEEEQAFVEEVAPMYTDEVQQEFDLENGAEGVSAATGEETPQKARRGRRGRKKHHDRPKQDETREAYEDFGMRPMFLPAMAKSMPYGDDEDDGYDSETDEAMAYLTAVQ